MGFTHTVEIDKPPHRPSEANASRLDWVVYANKLQAELKIAQAFIHLKTQECEGVRASLLTATQAVFITARERQELKDENAKLRELAQAVVYDSKDAAQPELIVISREAFDNLATALEGGEG
jgi:hypothetical protein